MWWWIDRSGMLNKRPWGLDFKPLDFPSSYTADDRRTEKSEHMYNQKTEGIVHLVFWFVRLFRMRFRSTRQDSPLYGNTLTNGETGNGIDHDIVFRTCQGNAIDGNRGWSWEAELHPCVQELPVYSSSVVYPASDMPPTSEGLTSHQLLSLLIV